MHKKSWEGGHWRVESPQGHRTKGRWYVKCLCSMGVLTFKQSHNREVPRRESFMEQRTEKKKLIKNIVLSALKSCIK